MISLPLYKKMLTKNGILFWSFAAVIIFYLGTIILSFAAFDALAADEEAWEAFTEFMALFGYDIGLWTDALLYTSEMFFGVTIYMFLMVLFIILAFRLGYKVVDNGSLGAYLNAGISRTKYLNTAATCLLTKVFILHALVFLVGIICFAILGNEFSALNYLNLVLMTMMVMAAVIFVSFFFGVVFAGRKLAAGLLIAVPVGLLFLLLMSALHESIEFLRWLSIFGWFNHMEVAAGSRYLWWLLALGGYVAVIAVAWVASVLIFKRKNLSL